MQQQELTLEKIFAEFGRQLDLWFKANYQSGNIVNISNPVTNETSSEGTSTNKPSKESLPPEEPVEEKEIYDLFYCDKMELDDDGLPCFSIHSLTSNASFYEFRIQDKTAKVYITSDTTFHPKMIEEFNDYLSECIRENGSYPSGINCKIITVTPGIYKLEGNIWKEESPITIKFEKS